MDRRSKEHEYNMKVVLIGNSSVGKSSLMLRLTEGTFNDTYVTTIGVDFRFKTMVVDGQKVKIQVWDTAGQEKFRTMTSTYYKASHAIIMVYDVTDPTSYRDIAQYWVKEIQQHVSNIIFVLLGNKSDLAHLKKVNPEEARQLRVGNSPVIFYEVSAKDDTNVQQAFEDIARMFIKHKKEERRMRAGGERGTLSNRPSSTQQAAPQPHQSSQQPQDDFDRFADGPKSSHFPTGSSTNTNDLGGLDDNNDIYNLHAHLSDGATKKKEEESGGCKC